MRRALAPLAALLLAACQVDVEGAICDVPGTTSDCPSGQACGNDGRCSRRALACETAGTRCAPGTARCAGDDDEERVERCSGELDAACGAWVAEDCHAAGLACGTRSGAAECECPPFDGPELAADPVAGSPDPQAVPFPTGAVEPAPCRFGRLGDALARAAQWRAEHVGAPAIVRALSSALEGAVFSAESFPLEIPPDVTVVADAPQEIVIRATSAAGPLIEVAGTLDGGEARLRLESVGATGSGVRTSCGDGSLKPRVVNVTVDGGGTLAKGIDVEGGTCGAELSGVDVSAVSGPALEVGGDALGSPVTVTASTFRGSAVGVRAKGGKLTLGSPGVAAYGVPAVQVSGNAGNGILLTGGAGTAPATVEVEVLGTLVEGNGGTGVVLNDVSVTSRLTMRAGVVRANGAVSPEAWGPATAKRQVGGVLIRQDGLAADGFHFEGNSVYANGRDQLAFETVGAWSIAPQTCGGASNLFACVPADGVAVGVAGATTGGTVNANYSVVPGLSTRYFYGPVAASEYCLAGTGGAPPPVLCASP